MRDTARGSWVSSEVRYRLPLDGALFGRDEIDQAPLLIDALDRAIAKIIDVPGAGRELPKQMPVVVVQIQVLKAVASRCPDELRRFPEERQLIVQFDPRVAGFGQYHAARAGGDVREEQIQPTLIAAFALNGEGLAVGQPIHARKINILLGPQVDPGRPRRSTGRRRRRGSAHWHRPPPDSAAQMSRRCPRRSRSAAVTFTGVSSTRANAMCRSSGAHQ